MDAHQIFWTAVGLVVLALFIKVVVSVTIEVFKIKRREQWLEEGFLQRNQTLSWDQFLTRWQPQKGTILFELTYSRTYRCWWIEEDAFSLAPQEIHESRYLGTNLVQSESLETFARDCWKKYLDPKISIGLMITLEKEQWRELILALPDDRCMILQTNTNKKTIVLRGRSFFFLTLAMRDSLLQQHCQNQNRFLTSQQFEDRRQKGVGTFIIDCFLPKSDPYLWWTEDCLVDRTPYPINLPDLMYTESNEMILEKRREVEEQLQQFAESIYNEYVSHENGKAFLCESPPKREFFEFFRSLPSENRINLYWILGRPDIYFLGPFEHDKIPNRMDWS